MQKLSDGWAYRHNACVNLRLVPTTEQDAKTAMVERLKAIARPDGMVQCPRCAGRETMTIRSGDTVQGGRVKAGLVLEKGICPHCWKQGVIVDLIPPKPKPVKQPKPRRTKPKLV